MASGGTIFSGSLNNSTGKVKVIPAITTYKGSTSNTIKVSVDNENRIIKADILDSVLKQRGITRVWYDVNPESINYKWLCYSIADTEKSCVRVVQLPSLAEFENLVSSVSNLQSLVDTMFSYLAAGLFSIEPNFDTEDCYTLVVNPLNSI